MRDLFSPVFQPIMPVASSDVYAYEAFLRVKGDQSNSARQIGRWERSKLIMSADRGMISRVRESVLSARLGGKCRISINISPLTIASEAKEAISELVRLRAICPRVIVDVSEAAARNYLSRFVEFVRLAHHEQISIAFDDARLDTGFCTVSLAEQLRPRFIKIDGTYLLGLRDTPQYSRIIKFIEDVKVLGVKIVVKNIDGNPMLHCAVLAGADYLQGYLIAQPAPLEILRPTKTPQAVHSSPGVLGRAPLHELFNPARFFPARKQVESAEELDGPLST